MLGVRHALSAKLPKIVLGSGNFSYQSHRSPESLPVREIISEALERGIRAFDTSPYYGPSEELLGDALSQPAVTCKFRRSDYLLMTKAGRIAENEFDYSPEWIRFSVNRSLERLKTDYLDVVFCHDVEFVTDSEALEAIRVLLALIDEGKILYVGISGYRIEKLVRLASKVRDKYNRPLDAVQCWGQLTLQNSRLESRGLPELLVAGVDCVLSSSPLAIGLLRPGGVPVGSLGDFHPAPDGLREVTIKAAKWVQMQNDDLPALAIRYSISRLILAAERPVGATTIFAVSDLSELRSCLLAVSAIWKKSLAEVGERESSNPVFRDLEEINLQRVEQDERLVHEVHTILGDWVDYSFSSPDLE
jgi:aryl-alcohol dehydrogenase-like predicted oxidoreductase